MPLKEINDQNIEQSSPIHPSDEYPEGGTKAWLVVLGAWCAMIPSMGLLNSLGTLQAWTSTHQLNGYSQSSIGWIFGAYTFFLFLGGGQFGMFFSPVFQSYSGE